MNVFNNYDKAISEFDKLIPYFREIGNQVFYAYILDYQINCQIASLKLDDANENLDLLYNYIDTDSVGQCDYYIQSDYYFLHGFYNYKLGNLNLSTISFQKSLEFFYYGEGSSKGLFLTYEKLAHCYYLMGDYSQAIHNFNLAFNNIDSYITDNLQSFCYSTLAMCYLKNNDLEQAKEYLDIAANTLNYESTDLDQYSVYYLGDLAQYTLKTGDLSETKLLLDSIVSLNPKTHELLNYYQKYGDLELKLNNFEKAESYFLKGINLCRDTFNYNKYKIAETYLFTSDAYHSVDKDIDGLIYIDTCLLTLIPDFRESIKLDPSKTRNHRLTVEALLLKAELLSKNKEYSRSKVAIKQSQLYLDHMFHKKLLSQESRLFFVNKMKKDYEKVIRIALDNNDPSFAFEVSQKIHGNLLSLELFKDEVARRFNVPLEYTDYVQNLKVRISSKESNLLGLNKDENQSKYDSLNQDLQYFKGELNNVLESIEHKYPDYYKLKYTSPKVNSIKSIQKNKLTKNSALVEYFMGEDHLYTFIITKNNLNVLTTEIDSSLVDNIILLNASTRSLYGDFNTFLSSSSSLYDYLLKDVFDFLGQGINVIYIIPDNELYYVPFEVLINKIPEQIENERYDLLPYLVKDYSISYHYSSALINNKNNILIDKMTGFAPSFTSSYSVDENIKSLPHNKKEVLIISDITDGQIRIDTAANLKNIKESVNHFRIAHLATHASCNDTLPFESKIYFEDGPLYAYEIYNMPHQLDLAVLSACETGTGALKNGEGLMSLARAFISSGCKSVITTLWNVNDKKTVNFVERFYTHLYSGKNLGQTVTRTKRDYLNNLDSVLDAHPYYWAPFIMIGDADIRIITVPWTELFLLLFLVLLTSVVFLKTLSTA